MGPVAFGGRVALNTGMNLLVVVVLIFNAQLPTNSSDLRLPHYDWNACPFECCVYRTWKANSVVKIFQERRLNSPIAFELRPGDSVLAFTGVVVTRKAGEVRVLRDGFIGELKTAVRSGDVIRVLRPQGEGFWKIWLKGRVDSAELLNLDDLPPEKGLQLVRRPEIVWWVKVRTPDGRVGWTTATEAFDGTDACG